MKLLKIIKSEFKESFIYCKEKLKKEQAGIHQMKGIWGGGHCKAGVTASQDIVENNRAFHKPQTHAAESLSCSAFILLTLT